MIDATDERTLARARGADQSDDMPFADPKADPVEGLSLRRNA